MFYDKKQITKQTILDLIDGSIKINSNNRLVKKSRDKYNISIIIETHNNLASNNTAFEYVEVISDDYEEKFIDIIKKAVELRNVIPKEYRVVVHDTPNMTIKYETDMILSLTHDQPPEINTEFLDINHDNISLTEDDVRDIIKSRLI